MHLQQLHTSAGLINERKDVPKAMGMLATAIAVGGFGGSIIAGILTDMGLLKVAILMPAVPLILGDGCSFVPTKTR